MAVGGGDPEGRYLLSSIELAGTRRTGHGENFCYHQNKQKELIGGLDEKFSFSPKLFIFSSSAIGASISRFVRPFLCPSVEKSI